jgi:type I site-specific restriction-modification system R (restriction) subunit
MVYSKSKKSKKSKKLNKTKKGGSYSSIHKERGSLEDQSLVYDNSTENAQRAYEKGYNNGSKKHPKLILNRRIIISLYNSNEDPVTELKIKNVVDQHIGSDCIVKKAVRINKNSRIEESKKNRINFIITFSDKDLDNPRVKTFIEPMFNEQSEIQKIPRTFYIARSYKQIEFKEINNTTNP